MNPVMNRVHGQVRVAAPVEHAFELVNRIDRQREWNQHLTFYHVDQMLDRATGEFDVIMDLLGQATNYVGSVLEVKTPELLHVHLTGAHGTADWVYRFEPAGDTTIVTLDIAYTRSGHLAGLIDKVIYHDGLERAVEHILAKLAASAIPTPVIA